MHATDRAENITSSAMFIASLADATRTIKLGTGTINMPNAHPVATASQIAMLDHMLDGRFIFGISPGGLLSDAEAFGNLDADRNAMFVEAINAVLEIWAREPPYDITGKYWTIRVERQAMLEIGLVAVLAPTRPWIGVSPSDYRSRDSVLLLVMATSFTADERRRRVPPQAKTLLPSIPTWENQPSISQ